MQKIVVNIFSLIFLLLIPHLTTATNQDEIKNANGATGTMHLVYQAATGMHNAAKRLFGFHPQNEADKEKAKSIGENHGQNNKEEEEEEERNGQAGQGRFSRIVCKMTSMISDQFGFRAMLKEESAKKVMGAFINIRWQTIGTALRSKNFSEAVNELKKPLDVLLAELIGGKKEVLGKKLKEKTQQDLHLEKELLQKRLKEKTQDLRFMNAVVMLVLENIMPAGCFTLVTKFYDDSISKKFALQFITTMHPEWVGREHILEEEMDEKEKAFGLATISLDLQKSEAKQMFVALLHGDTKEMGNLIKEKEQLKKELEGNSTGMFKLMVERMLKRVPANVGAKWAEILFEEQINMATNHLSGQIAPMISAQVPSIVDWLMAANGKKGGSGMQMETVKEDMGED